MREMELSIVIPTLNEAQTIIRLVESLVTQQHAPVFEIIVVDGGSSDGTVEELSRLQDELAGLLRFYQSAAGRARQMNTGAAQAQGAELLFLHADTIITDGLLLHQAHQDMQQAYASAGGQRVVGHFGLHFARSESGYEQAYYFYEAKTRLNRPGCVNGDQGMWLKRAFFLELGRFDESLAYLEDARLAEKVFQRGKWVTLSGCVFTSARRFESEGMRARQILNALLCAMDAIGAHEFFQLAAAYRAQSETRFLALRPYLRIIHQITWAKGVAEGARRWWGTGKYVADNAWQLAFAWDCRESLAADLPVSDVKAQKLALYDRYLKWLVVSPFGQFFAMLMTFVWFYWLLLWREREDGV